MTIQVKTLKGYWNMDETSGDRADSSGNGLDLSPINGVTYAPGYEGNALQYQFTEERVETDQANWNLFGDPDFEITFRYQFHWSDTPGNWIFLMFHAHGYQPSPYIYNYISVYGTSNGSNQKIIEVFINCNGAFTYWEPPYPSGGLVADTWYKITFKKVGDTMIFLVDDVAPDPSEMLDPEWISPAFGNIPFDTIQIGNVSGNFSQSPLQNRVDNVGFYVTEDVEPDYSYDSELVAVPNLYSAVNYLDAQGVCVAPVEGCIPEALMTRNSRPVADIEMDDQPTAAYSRSPYPEADMVCKIKSSQ
jgi:hypothetical protein